MPADAVAAEGVQQPVGAERAVGADFADGAAAAGLSYRIPSVIASTAASPTTSPSCVMRYRVSAARTRPITLAPAPG